MKPWRLTPSAEQSLVSIISWTIRQFGKAQAVDYKNKLIDRINGLASGQPPLAKSCSFIMPDEDGVGGLVYYREGRHFIVMRDGEELQEVLEFLHESMNLPEHLQRLEKAKP